MSLDRREDVDPPRLTPMEIMVRLADLPDKTRHAFLATMQDWVGVQKTHADASFKLAQAEDKRAEAGLYEAKTAWLQEITAAVSAYLLCALAIAAVVILAMLAMQSLDVVQPSERMYIVAPAAVGIIGVFGAVVRALTRRK